MDKLLSSLATSNKLMEVKNVLTSKSLRIPSNLLEVIITERK